MDRTAYWGVFATASGTVSVVAAWANRSGGIQRLLVATLVASSMLLLAGLADWARLAHKETPLHFYAVAAVVPTIITALAIRRLSEHGAGYSTQIVVGATIWLVVAVAALLLTYFP